MTEKNRLLLLGDMVTNTMKQIREIDEILERLPETWRVEYRTQPINSMEANSQAFSQSLQSSLKSVLRAELRNIKDRLLGDLSSALSQERAIVPGRMVGNSDGPYLIIVFVTNIGNVQYLHVTKYDELNTAQQADAIFLGTREGYRIAGIMRETSMAQMQTLIQEWEA